MPCLKTASNENADNAGKVNLSNNEAPFFRLSAELRNQIYELVYQDAIITIPTTPNTTYPGLLLACKQTYHESLKIFYDLFELHSTSTKWLRKGLQRMAREKRDLLQAVVVDRVAGVQVPGAENDRQWRASRIIEKFERRLQEQGTLLRSTAFVDI
ncbi:hypothetical protein PRZ48_000053 [Zasmidium cellare]|uniref:Uncharacterized protein n=1 Tax=Zasmidium cellare TaxID=395010 RepID=A0ABR0EYZ8_ZASCE|nr:hypothetical protein PRZ48_000053 [Zasmidium cellare]